MMIVFTVSPSSIFPCCPSLDDSVFFFIMNGRGLPCQRRISIFIFKKPKHVSRDGGIDCIKVPYLHSASNMMEEVLMDILKKIEQYREEEQLAEMGRNIRRLFGDY